MSFQLFLGFALIGITTAIQTIGITVGMAVKPRLARSLNDMTVFKSILLMSASAMWVLFGIVISVALWATTLIWLGAFDSFERSIYYALASYTTLGFGDVLPPQEWRILGAMIGANGMLGFGLATAAMVEVMRQIRIVEQK